MRELVVSKNEAGQRFDKYLFKYLNKAGSGFVYQMLRKKNIVLNDKKAAGNERLNVGDVVKLYLAEDTINSLSLSDVFSPSSQVMSTLFKSTSSRQAMSEKYNLPTYS